MCKIDVGHFASHLDFGKLQAASGINEDAEWLNKKEVEKPIEISQSLNYLAPTNRNMIVERATITAGTISSVPFLYGAGKITRKYGHVNIIIVAFFSHAARLIGYSFIENAWWCFPFEVIEAVAVHLMWIAAATYCALLAPKNLLATLIGVLGMAHFSLGRGSGSFFGGFLIGTVGTRESFRIMGMLAIVGGITYGLLHYFWLRKVEAGNNSKEEQQDTAPRHWSLRRTHYTDTRHKNTKLTGAIPDSLVGNQKLSPQGYR
uniref:Major facilitator superfamily associated domain-containing protein n=2 Tax=Timema TaxID=61471 RepID=A0A7R9G3I7_TIMSH|nr:unnamed protein product [Timema shepardi]